MPVISVVSVAPPAPPPVTPAPSLQAPEGPVGPRPAMTHHPEPTPPARPDFAAPPGPPPIQETLRPAAPTPDVEMSVEEETSESCTTSTTNSTRDGLIAFIERNPGGFFARTDALGLGREEVLDLSSKTRARKRGPLLSPPQMDAITGLIGQPLTLRPGGTTNVYKILRQVKAELRSIPAAVPPTPPLPAPRPAEPTPPALHGKGHMPSSASPRSVESAEQEPGRPSILSPTGGKNSQKNGIQKINSRENSEIREYANPPVGVRNANLAAARVDVTSGMAAASSSNGAALTIRNWADCDEVMNPGTDDDFTVVKNKKRRRVSNSPTAATPSSNIGSARTNRRLQSSAGSVPRAQELRTTRAHIAEARTRQASSSEEHCVYLEHSPELQPFHYLRALDRMLGGTAGVIQISKVSGHQLLGLANRGLAERLINEGLEVEGTLLRVFPFRKRAERITVGNLPFFVEDSAIINALKPYGRITYIAPKMMKTGPYIYCDGRREAFIVPTMECHGQGHRRANCPLLAGRVNTTRSAPPASPAGLQPTTTPAPPQRPTPQHSAPAPPLEISGASPASRAAIHPAGAPRPSPTAPSASPTEETPPAPPTVTPDPSSQAPRDPASQEILGPANITQDIEMTAVEESIPPSASSNKKCTRIDLAAFIKRSPSVSFAGTDALGLGREEVLDLLSSNTKAHKRGRHLTPPQSNALAGLINQILDLRPGGSSNIYKVLRQVMSELRTGPAAVPPTSTLPAPRPSHPTPLTSNKLTPAMITPPPPAPTKMEEDVPMTEEERCVPPLPAPRLAEPTPPTPQGQKTTPAMATPPPPPSVRMEDDSEPDCWTDLVDLIDELFHGPGLEPILRAFDADEFVDVVRDPEMWEKSSTRIMVGNLPFFVADDAIVDALSRYGRITSITPKLLKAGEFTCSDGRREAFIILHDGITIDKLPTRFEIRIKGEAWPAFLSHGIKCSKCHGQGHRRANCPQLHGRSTTARRASPPPSTDFPPSTAPALPRRSSAAPPAPTPPSPAAEASGAPPIARDALLTSAPRPSTPVPPASSAQGAAPAPTSATPAPEDPVDPRSAASKNPEPTPPARPDLVALRGPLPVQETLGHATLTLDVEMTEVDENTASFVSFSKKNTRKDLVVFLRRNPGVSFAGTDALGLGREEVLDLLSPKKRDRRRRPSRKPPHSNALAGLINQILNLKPGGTSNVYKILGQ
ncbi:hypothetical protein LAZ67_2003383, partial [Cordylochernes scorpioides]